MGPWTWDVTPRGSVHSPLEAGSDEGSQRASKASAAAALLLSHEAWVGKNGPQRNLYSKKIQSIPDSFTNPEQEQSLRGVCYPPSYIL